MLSSHVKTQTHNTEIQRSGSGQPWYKPAESKIRESEQELQPLGHVLGLIRVHVLQSHHHGTWWRKSAW
jgi:hypothetical protein